MMEGTMSTVNDVANRLKRRYDVLKRLNGTYKKKPHMHKERSMHTKRMEALQVREARIERERGERARRERELNGI